MGGIIIVVVVGDDDEAVVLIIEVRVDVRRRVRRRILEERMELMVVFISVEGVDNFTAPWRSFVFPRERFSLIISLLSEHCFCTFTGGWLSIRIFLMADALPFLDCCCLRRDILLSV